MRCSPRVSPPRPRSTISRMLALAADDRRDVGLQVGAGAERLVAGAGEDRHVDGVVVAEVGPRRAQRLVRLEIDRVARLPGGRWSRTRSGRACRRGRSSWRAVHHATMARCFASPPSPSPRSRGCGPSPSTRSSSPTSGPVGDRAFHVREADGDDRADDAQPAPRAGRAQLGRATGARARLPRRPARRGAGGARRGGRRPPSTTGARCPGAWSRGPSPPRCRSTSGARSQLVAHDEGVTGGDDHPVTLMSDGSLAAVSRRPRRRGRRPAALSDDDRDRGRAGVGGGRLGRPRGDHRHGHPARRRAHRALRGDDARPRRRPRRPADPARPGAACAASATSPSACGATWRRPASCAWATRSRPR